MGLFTFVCGVFAFIVAASFALSSTDPKPLSIEVLAWKEQGRIVKVGMQLLSFLSFLSFFSFPFSFRSKGPSWSKRFCGRFGWEKCEWFNARHRPWISNELVRVA